MQKTFIFDLDDTLIPCEIHYSRCTIMFISRMYEEFLKIAPTRVPTPQIISHLVEEENSRLINEQGGFYKEIFAQAFVETYRKLCALSKLEPIKETEEQVFQLGMSVFDPENYQNTVLPGVIETLNFLLEKGDEILVYTKGPEDSQRMKIEVNGLTTFFPNPIITHNKHHDQLKKIIGARDKERTFKVGNSVKSDINPALAAGIRAIHIPAETWSHEDEMVKDPEKVIVFSHIQDIMRRYDELG
ncbi:MAG: HAD hydrolase-like protein [Nanoarchaeota archaeon]